MYSPVILVERVEASNHLPPWVVCHESNLVRQLALISFRGSPFSTENLADRAEHVGLFGV